MGGEAVDGADAAVVAVVAVAAAAARQLVLPRQPAMTQRPRE